MIKRLGRGLAASIEKVAGRRQLVRASRFLLDYGRLDTPNRMSANGEFMVQDTILATARSEDLIAIDVGAHIGEWTTRLVNAARQHRRAIHVHAFEPAAATFDQLTTNLRPDMVDCVVPVHAALSDHGGKATLFKAHDLAGSNSLHQLVGYAQGTSSEEVDLTTLDDYCRLAGIDRIDLLKIDAEGHDHLVLYGARSLLDRGAIDVIQFEYNFRWIGARRYLKDVFDDLTPIGYEIGKVTPRGIEWYSRWSAELETFREGNYLAVRSASRHRFPAVRWWGDA